MARISRAEQGSIVSGHLISMLGATRISGIVSNAPEPVVTVDLLVGFTPAAFDLPLEDLRPPDFESTIESPGPTVASLPR